MSQTLPTGHILHFTIGQMVYLKTDKDQHARMITGIQLRPHNSVMYYLSLGTTESGHYDIEINDEKDIMMTL